MEESIQMSEAWLEQMGEIVRDELGEELEEERRTQQREALASRRMTAPPRRIWPAAVAAAAVLGALGSWFARDGVDGAGPQAGPTIAATSPSLLESRWIQAPRGKAVDVELGPKAHAKLLPGGRLRVSDQGAATAQLTLEEGRLELRATGGEWVVVAGPYETRVEVGQLEFAWSPPEESLTVEVESGDALVSGSHLASSGLRIEAGSVLDALVPEQSAILRKSTEDSEAAAPKFVRGRVPDVETRPELARAWASYYLEAHPDGEQIDVARELLLRSFADARTEEGARAAAEGYLRAAPNGPHASLAREIVAETNDDPSPP